MDSEHFRRRMEKRRDTKPQSVHAVLNKLGSAQYKPNQVAEESMDVKYIQSRNLRSRTKLVGTTPFRFDSDGVCRLEVKPGRGAILYDLEQLLKMNGFSLVEDPKAEKLGDSTSKGRKETNFAPPLPLKAPEEETSDDNGETWSDVAQVSSSEDSGDDDNKDNKSVRRRGRRKASADKEND